MTLGLVHAQKPISCKTDFLYILWIFTNGHLFTMASSPQSHLFSPPEQQYNVKSIILFFIGALLNLPHLNVLFFFQCAFQKLAEEPYKRQKYLKIVKCTLNLTIERKVNLYNQFIFYVAEYVICLPHISFPPPLSLKERD